MASRRVELVVLDERLADGDAARLEEGVGHRAADDQAVHFAEHVLDDVDLVRHLRAADDRDERPLRRLERVAQIFQLLLHQQARRRRVQVVRDPFHRRVRPVRRAERVVHVHVGERRELLRERRVVFLFFGMKAQVLEEYDRGALRVRGVNGLVRGVADAVFGERHRPAEQLREPGGHRTQAHVGIRLAFRPPQVAREDHRAAAFEHVLNRRQRSADAGVVADHAVLQRDVEVDADEDPLALEVEIPDRELQPRDPCLTILRSRSTQRFE